MPPLAGELEQRRVRDGHVDESRGHVALQLRAQRRLAHHVVLRGAQVGERGLEIGVLPREVVDEPLALLAEPVALHALPDDVQQLLRIPRLQGEVIDVGGVDRRHERVGIGERRQENAHGLRRHLEALRQQVRAEHSGHALVADDDRDALPHQHLQRFRRTFGADDAVVHSEHRFERVEHARFVVHQENSRGLAHRRRTGHDGRRVRGSRTVKVAPPPGGLSARISPPCFLTIS